MSTMEAVLAALNELRGDLEARTWRPDEYERVLANTMQAEGGASARAVREGLRAVGPEVTHGRLAAVAARCAAVLDSPSRAASEDGRALHLALDDVLDLVVRATADRLSGRAAVSRRRRPSPACGA
ncbi:hypothetical protein [Streptomyces turgidiscabies]|uniref:hypothetical protein n=1 Tax=Streptomyces turgidiscabies TaxID=85558 RepID=UPI0038F6DC10